MSITLGSVTDILTFMSVVAATVTLVSYSIWQIILYRKLLANERAIRAKENEVDGIDSDITARTTGHLVNEDQRLRMVTTARTRPLRELERLKQERQFLLDKLPFAKK
ncbi:hypothetical protein JNJ66_03490 [Candidatus Saccharibacteria bacterium]|nr:hypothetical protein [Candidatus Saccharibacteria bacterium]